MRPTGGAPGAPISTRLQFVLQLTVATYDVARAQPGRGQCGWSAAPQQRGTPSLTSTKLSNNQVNKYKRRSVSGRVMCSTGLYLFSRAFAFNKLCRAINTRSCDLYVMPLGATFLSVFPLSALSKVIVEVAFRIIGKLCIFEYCSIIQYLQKRNKS